MTIPDSEQSVGLMTARDRLLGVLRGEPPKVTSWAPYIGGPHFELMFPEYRLPGQDAATERSPGYPDVLTDEAWRLDQFRFEVQLLRVIGADVA